MILRRFLTHSLAALALTTLGASAALAQDGHTHAPAAELEKATPEAVANASALIATVQKATERFKDVNKAIAEGYALQFGCVSGDTGGAMGMHYINGAILSTGVIDANRPQIVIYEPAADGTLQLIGADFLVFKASWDATHASPPQLMGQMFHLFDAPNRFGLPAFYTLHVWAWKKNPNGAFVNWHPNVNCQNLSGAQN